MADSIDHTSEPDLGGRLLYAGELDLPGCAMVVAGNVAGCATLAVTADEAGQKMAIRDGVVDFVVTSLDEALRILKNEIRKCNNVGVCVGAGREAVEQEMIERGVLPDLVFVGTVDRRRKMSCFGEHVRQVLVSEPDAGVAMIAWQVSEGPGRWMPRLDAIALDCLAKDPWMQRWMRLSPRILGRAHLAERAFYCAPEAAIEIVRQFSDAVETGAIGAEVSVSLTNETESKVLRLRPPAV